MTPSTLPLDDARTTPRAMISPHQLRAARALLDWTREDLAKKSSVAAITIRMFENGTTDPKVSTLLKVVKALGAAGVEFTADAPDHGAGVRFRRPQK